MLAASIVLFLGLLGLCSAEYPYPSIIYGRSCDVDLIFDQALVQFTTNTFGYGLYATNSQCYKCERQLVSADTSSNLCEIMYSPFYWTFDLVETSTGNVVYSIDLKLEQHAQYMITADIDTTGDTSYSMSHSVIKKGNYDMTGLLVWIGIFIPLIVLCFAYPRSVISLSLSLCVMTFSSLFLVHNTFDDIPVNTN